MQLKANEFCCQDKFFNSRSNIYVRYDDLKLILCESIFHVEKFSEISIEISCTQIGIAVISKQFIVKNGKQKEIFTIKWFLHWKRWMKST